METEKNNTSEILVSKANTDYNSNAINTIHSSKISIDNFKDNNKLNNLSNDEDSVLNISDKLNLQINQKEKNNNEMSENNEDTKISLAKAVVLVGKMAVGVAVFSLSQTFLSLSFYFGIFLIIVYGAFNLCTFNLLAYLCTKYEIYDYARLVEKILGKKAFYIYNAVILISCFITIIAYINVGKSLYV